MSMTWGDIKLATLQKMFAADGSEIPNDESTVDYIAGMPYAANEALQRLSTAGKFITKKMVIAHLPLENMIADNTALAVTYISKNNPYKIKVGSAYSYYFEFSGKATLKITCGAVIEETELLSKGTYTQFKGMIDNEYGNDVLFEITTTYPSSIKNIALYEAEFDDEEEIPDYGVKVRYDLKEIADDFYNMFDNQIFYESGQTPYYIDGTEYYRESDYVLLLDRDKPGSYTLYYHAYPPEITVDTDDEYVLPVDQDVAVLIPLYMASQLYKDDDNSISTVYRNEFEIGLESLKDTSDSFGKSFVSESGWS